MFEKVFDSFHFYFTERCEKIPLLNISEDSLRYDFFYSLTQVLQLKPSEIQLEVPIHTNSFNARNNIKANRKEKPQLDLVVDLAKLKLSVEFGLFRQNSNDTGPINTTSRTVKMLNDMIRLAIDSNFTKRKSYFICVADDTILGHRLRTKIIGSFPSSYLIDQKVIDKQLTTKTSAFDKRFLSVFKTLKISINSNLIFDREIKAAKINRQTRMLIWEINMLKLNS